MQTTQKAEIWSKYFRKLGGVHLRHINFFNFDAPFVYGFQLRNLHVSDNFERNAK
jgi:hypothetical protein